MFKKLKDKLAEEVKSSPQRIQQFAQAAQAAVTSASSSITDISNNDLFSIGDNDNPQSAASRPSQKQQNTFQDVSLTQSPSSEIMDYGHEMENQRQRRLSNSSFASDVSFRLPSYETPSTYHLQSDMEVSASEADERGFSGGPATLDRVTKEQLYSAYKRTQERYTKYRNQYGDLARHYKLLERENTKARSVLVETQDKALRRISELKEQCALEQSAKAHLEKALRIEIEEKVMKIEALNTKVHLLQNPDNSNITEQLSNDSDGQLISLATDNPPKHTEEPILPDITSLTNKIEKMEQLLNKYKDSLKISKDKNSQITVELQTLSNEIESKNKQILELKSVEEHLIEANIKIKELNESNEELQNQINAHDFTKIKELSTFEMDLQKANEEITELRGKIEIFSKKEEEYAISLAENKLSIHKELESKEAEIKSLKDGLSTSKQEVQSLKIVVDDYKNSLAVLEEDKAKLNKDCTELTATRVRIDEMNSQLQELLKKCQSLEQLKTKADEEYKCLQLQFKQETAEKLAMIDRNMYLESRNTQLSEENMKKNLQITNIENELHNLSRYNIEASAKDESEVINLRKETNMWKEKCNKLESEIQEEREELVKLQTEIEKLLTNHETIQTQNAEYRTKIAELTKENAKQQEASQKHKSIIRSSITKLSQEVIDLRQLISVTSNEILTNKNALCSIATDVAHQIKKSLHKLEKTVSETINMEAKVTKDYENLKAELAESNSKNNDIMAENSALALKISQLSEELNTEESSLKNELLHKINAYEQSLADVKSMESQNELLHKNVKESEIEKQQMQCSLKKLESENQELIITISSLEEKCKLISKDLQTITCKHEESESFVESLSKQIEELNKSKDRETKAIFQIQSNLETEKARHLATIDLLQKMKIEKEDLTEKLSNVESHYTKSLLQLNELNELNQASNIKIKELEENIKTSDQIAEKARNQLVQLNADENKYHLVQLELEELKMCRETSEQRIAKLQTDINNKSKDCEKYLAQVKELNEINNCSMEENVKLKIEAANFTSNIEKLESDIEIIKTSHTEIETEKDRLNTIIEELERKSNSTKINLSETKDTQTEHASDPNDDVSNVIENSALFEKKWILENKQTAMNNTASLNLKSDTQEDTIEQYASVKVKYDALKEDNRRLQSDIEGLQSYLTKISKENSVLNDKLREVIATSEHSMDNDQLSTNVTLLKSDLQTTREKNNDLLRENYLLIEENLELKDQLDSQNNLKLPETGSSNKNHKDVNFKEKYDDLLQSSSDIKKRNMDLEQINKSISGNIEQLQDKNERLKLSNEKLEMRLDEALVSLRHLHSLSENTELEYLRNILYEYLTGTGAHSETLARVLAAIVKFDDIQTQMVLQKEKERQGFLRQLGII